VLGSSPHATDVSTYHPGLMNVEVRAVTAGYQLAQRPLKAQLVWWWQRLADPDDTRQPCWLERRQAISYMEGVLQREPLPRP
jgi:hypothetical protein